MPRFLVSQKAIRKTPSDYNTYQWLMAALPHESRPVRAHIDQRSDHREPGAGASGRGRASRVAKIILDYAEASFERSPILKQLIASRTADALELTNGITLEVRPASFRKLRGPTYVAVIADELAFWYVDAAYAIRTSRS